MATIVTSQAVNCACCGGPSPAICFPPTPRYICWHFTGGTFGVDVDPEIRTTFELHSIANQGPTIISRYIAYSYYYSNWCTFFLDIRCPTVTPSPYPGTYQIYLRWSDPFAYTETEGCWGLSPGLGYFENNGLLSSASPVAASPVLAGVLAEGSCAPFVGPGNQDCIPDLVSGSVATFSFPDGLVLTSSLCAGRGGILAVRDDQTSFPFYFYWFRCLFGATGFFATRSGGPILDLTPTGMSTGPGGIIATFDSPAAVFGFPGFTSPGTLTVTIPSVAHPPQTPPLPTTGHCGGTLAGRPVALTLVGSVSPGTYHGVWSTLRSGQDVAVFSTASGIVLVRWNPDGTSNMVLITGPAGTIFMTAPAVIGPVCGPPATATYDNGSGFSGVLVTL